MPVPNRPSAASEDRVFETASRFLAALLGAGRVNETNQAGVVRYCIRLAAQLVQEADRAGQPEPVPAAGAVLRDGEGDLEIELDPDTQMEKELEAVAYRARAPQAGPPRKGP